MFCSCPQSEVTQDPEEAVRLQQLQAAAAHWQQVQQQRAGLQYQALMQQHEKLQQILEKYQQLIQQPVNLQVGKCLTVLYVTDLSQLRITTPTESMGISVYSYVVSRLALYSYFTCITLNKKIT